MFFEIMGVIRNVIVLLSLSALSSCYAIESEEADEKVFICYWGSWSHYRVGNGRFSVENINPHLCTHLVYAFAKLENGVIAAFDPWLDLDSSYPGGGLDMYKKFNALKKVNPRLKTIIAIGGWNEGSTKYSKMASTAEGRQKFVRSVVDFLGRHGFDGLDVDWEYPTTRGGVEQDQNNFVLLLKELKAHLKPANYLLTAAVSAGKPTIESAYNVTELADCLDLVSVMGYDYFGAWGKTTGHNAPLRARENATELEKIFNVESSLDLWLLKGADRKKLALGMPLYGRTFTLADPKQSGYMAPTIGPGQAGQFTREPGFLGYNEICKKVSSFDWTITEERNVAAPVAVKGREWIGYDNVTSITRKVLLAMSKGLAGAMVWSIETDDFRGNCKDGRNPLLNSIHSTLKLPSPLPERPAHLPEIRVMGTQDATQKLTEKDCQNEGFMPHPENPRKFYRCTLLPNRKVVIRTLECAPGTIFSSELRTCVHSAISEKGKTVAPPVSPGSREPPTTLATDGARQSAHTQASPAYDTDPSQSSTTIRDREISETSSSAHHVTITATERQVSSESPEHDESTSSNAPVTLATTPPVREVTPEDTYSTVREQSTEAVHSYEDFRCLHVGIHAHPTDRKKFYTCVEAADRAARICYTITCPLGTIFDVEIVTCNHDTSPFVRRVAGKGYPEGDLLLKCEGSESFTYPDYPLNFCVCDKIYEGQYRVHGFYCPPGTIFSNANRKCVHTWSEEAGVSDPN